MVKTTEIPESTTVLKASQLSIPKPIAIVIPIFFGLALGFLVSRDGWFFALILAAMVPLAILFTSRPFIGVILWLVLMLLSSALPSPEMMYWALHRILVPLILCLTFLPHLLKQSRLPRFRIGLPEVCIALLVVYVPISILLAGRGMGQPLIKFADRMLVPFCMYLAVRLTILRSNELRLLQWSAFFIAASQLSIAFTALFAPQVLPYAWRPHLEGYAAGSLINPNIFAIALGFCICILFHAAMERKPGPVRTLFIVTCGASVIGIFLSMERAAWLAGVLILLGLLALYPRSMLRYLIIAAIAMIVIGGAFFSQFSRIAVERFGNRGTIDDRIVVTDAMLQMIQVKPIFGWGYETLNNNLENYYRTVGIASGNIRFTTSHNSYLTVFTELGLVGFLLYMLPLLWLFGSSLRARRGLPGVDIWNRPLLATLWLAALQNLVIGNFMDMRFFPIGITFWWMSLGFIGNVLSQHTEARERSTAHQAALSPPGVRTTVPLKPENNGFNLQETSGGPGK